jgi:large subunit ribosomal protein L9
MAELKKEHETLAERISHTTLDFYSKAGESGKLYGSVTSHEIADRLNGALGIEVDRRSLVGAPLRQLGHHKVVVRLSRDFQPAVTVVVHPEGGTGRKHKPAAEPLPEAQPEPEPEPDVATQEMPSLEPEVVPEEMPEFAGEEEAAA